MMITDEKARYDLKAEASQAYRQEYSEKIYLQRYLQVVHELLSQKDQYGEIREYDVATKTFADRKFFGR